VSILTSTHHSFTSLASFAAFADIHHSQLIFETFLGYQRHSSSQENQTARVMPFSLGSIQTKSL
jgi:hypothetical protein